MMATAEDRIHGDDNNNDDGTSSRSSSPMTTTTTALLPDSEIAAQTTMTKQQQQQQPVYKVLTRRRLTTTVQTQHPELIDKEDYIPKVTYVSFFCGITAGVIQAGLFNPWDRALYLSIKNDVPFLSYQNFQNPYTGFLQSVGHRALSGGLYYPLEHFFCSVLLDTTHNMRLKMTTMPQISFIDIQHYPIFLQGHWRDQLMLLLSIH